MMDILFFIYFFNSLWAVKQLLDADATSWEIKFTKQILSRVKACLLYLDYMENTVLVLTTLLWL